MLGTLAFPSGASIGSFPESFRPDGKMFSPALRMSGSGRSTIRAAVAEAPCAPAVESARKSANLYEVLRLKRNASQSEIKTAYRTLAKIYHPDVAAAAAKHPEESLDGCDFIEIHKAYSTLSDPAARAIYDLTLSIGSQRRRPIGIHNDSGSGGFRRPSRFYTTRRWETDQCW